MIKKFRDLISEYEKTNTTLEILQGELCDLDHLIELKEHTDEKLLELVKTRKEKLLERRKIKMDLQDANFILNFEDLKEKVERQARFRENQELVYSPRSSIYGDYCESDNEGDEGELC